MSDRPVWSRWRGALAGALAVAAVVASPAIRSPQAQADEASPQSQVTLAVLSEAGPSPSRAASVTRLAKDAEKTAEEKK